MIEGCGPGGGREPQSRGDQETRFTPGGCQVLHPPAGRGLSYYCRLARRIAMQKTTAAIIPSIGGKAGRGVDSLTHNHSLIGAS
jgi:hypothetical protein